MWILLIIALFAGIALLCWAMISGNSAVRLLAAFIAIVVAYTVGDAIGTSWERLKNYDQYIYNYSQYSKYMRGLAERQQLAELTNNIILFDTKFNAHQDAHDLQDVVFQIMKIGPYFEKETNVAKLLQATNSP